MSNTGDQLRAISGTLAIYPTTERKGRAKPVHIALKTTVLELYKTQKDFKNFKTPKYSIVFGELFNISLQNEPNQIKADCICLMTTDVTFFVSPNDPESSLNDWYELMLERIREARSIKVLRPVYREEFFEAAWDVVISKRPKLRKDYGKAEKIEDLAEKLAEIQGRKRLCVSATSFLLFKLGVSPTSDPDQPFEKEAFTDLPINVISNYGKQERYFFVRVGRCSEIGEGELWMGTEGGASATQLHTRISNINQRDAEKRRQQGVVLSVGGLSSRTLKSALLRQRAREKKEAKQQGEDAAREAAEEQAGAANGPRREGPPEKKKTPPPPEPIISIPPPIVTSPQMSITRTEPKITTPKKKAPFTNMGFKLRLHGSSSGASTGGMFTTNPEYRDVNEPMEVAKAFVPPPPPQSDKQTIEMPPPRTLSPRNCYVNNGEDYMSYDAVVDSRKASVANPLPFRQVSIMSGSESTNNMTTATMSTKVIERPEASDYIMMTNGFQAPDDIPKFLKEARSYLSDVSDSNESCYSSAAKRAKRESASDFGDDQSHGQRAYSLGSKPPLKAMPIAKNYSREFGEMTTSLSDDFKIEDIRKRAHSAGSKTWGVGSYRKVTDTTTPSDMRNRTSSFGTTSTFAALKQKRAAERAAMFAGKPVENDDHAVIDFSDSSNKGSLVSIDSPSARSRNSSIGVHQTNIRSAADTARQRQILEHTAEKLAAIKVENPRDASSPSGYPTSSKQNRRGSAPETTPIDSDYVPIMCKNAKRSRIIGTIMENIHSSSEPSSPEPMDDEDDHPLTPGRTFVTGAAVNQGSLDGYAVITTSTAGPTAPSVSALPVVQAFAPAPPLPPSTSTSSPTATSSPKHSSSGTIHCEYTVINTQAK